MRLLHVSLQLWVALSSFNWLKALIVELHLSQHRLHVKSLCDRRSVVDWVLCLLAIDCTQTLWVLMSSRVIDYIYLIFYNYLSFLTGLIAVWIVALIKTCISSTLLVVCVYCLWVTSIILVWKHHVVCSCWLNKLLRSYLFFKIDLRNRSIFLLNSGFLLSADLYLLLRSLVHCLTKLVTWHLENVIFVKIRILALVLLSTACRVVILVADHCAVKS